MRLWSLTTAPQMPLGTAICVSQYGFDANLAMCNLRDLNVVPAYESINETQGLQNHLPVGVVVVIVNCTFL